ncbi:MAG: undecaprenyl-phosphate glucose phosphotransferase [Spirochaetia bacterium]|jgi:Undecaprenyl-phosphate glucose phosphotransferase|nr:undecaprenyl-phosphate glucose phosphotransferase [Spirochaetia bacterium]
MLRERNETYMLLFAIVDMAVAFLAFWTAFFFRFIVFEGGDISLLFHQDLMGYLYIAILISIAQVTVFYFLDMYHSRKIGLLKTEFNSVIFGTVLTIFIALGSIFFLKTFRYSRLVIFYFGIINITLVFLFRSVIRAIIKRSHLMGKKLETILILGTGRSAKQIESIIKLNQFYGYKVSGFVQLTDKDNILVDKGSIFGRLEDLPSLLSEMHPYHVIYATDSADSDILRKAIMICSFEGIHLHLALNFSNLLTSRIHVESLEGIPLISMRDISARRGFNRLLKRVFDTLFSFSFIVLFSPIYILTALAVKLTSRGPIFLRQERVGLNNKTFMLLKFRTMYLQRTEESDTIWTKDHDPRVTPVGRFLRKFSLDEIPQFLNVLSGKMSVVGPRPERPYWVEQFKEKYIGYMQRHGMKAGITGWAQINGLRGDTSIEERVAADIYYIENWSFLLDLRIIILTPFKSIFDRNAY